ncbi:MAG: hypothetical protein M1818_004755 [Claussenomyces sp. TS43310]|nr:MAG: hypothetical protein M1818_004755 [Claussenomyces sp. TS43310]
MERKLIACIDLEGLDSESWTILGDAAFNFGSWTQLGVDDAALGWQSLYLLRAGVDPHAKSIGGLLWPLDTYLRGCTAHRVDHATKWLQVSSLTGVNLHEYARTEIDSHKPEHLLQASWDDDVWKWVPIKRRKVYRFGPAPDELEIWIEDYDALSWFKGGKYDLDLSQVLSSSESSTRWKRTNAHQDGFEPEVVETEVRIFTESFKTILASKFNVIREKWLIFLIATLRLNYLFHLYLGV